MPKDEFDLEDPMELSGVALLTEHDTTDAMCECFIEEYLRMGFNSKQLLALFQDPYYLGVNLVLEARGEPYVKDAIARVCARWGRPCAWLPAPVPAGPADTPAAAAPARTATDPLGAVSPRFQL